MLQAIEIQKTIEANLNCNFIQVNGDDGTHFDAVIVSDVFNGQSMIKQHQQVYSNWPTIPQLYIRGEFIGGADIIRELYESGELAKTISKE